MDNTNELYSVKKVASEKNIEAGQPAGTLQADIGGNFLFAVNFLNVLMQSPRVLQDIQNGP